MLMFSVTLYQTFEHWSRFRKRQKSFLNHNLTQTKKILKRKCQKMPRWNDENVRNIGKLKSIEVTQKRKSTVKSDKHTKRPNGTGRF